MIASPITSDAMSTLTVMMINFVFRVLLSLVIVAFIYNICLRHCLYAAAQQEVGSGVVGISLPTGSGIGMMSAYASAPPVPWVV
jgi:hypothetical protein